MPRDRPCAVTDPVAVQRDREIDYLQGQRSTETLWIAGGRHWATIRVEEIINDPKLDGLLGAMAVHNDSEETARRWRGEDARRREAARRRLAEATIEGEEAIHREREPKTKLLQPFLLTPTLRHLLLADAGRKQQLSASRGLAGQPAEIRKDLEEAADLAERLAALLDHLPQPRVALAAMEPDEVLASALFFGTALIDGGSTGARIVPASQLLRDLGGALEAMKVADTGQRLHGARENARLLRYAVRKLSKLFVEQLEKPRDADVAVLVKLLFDLTTDAEAVKKMRWRQK